LEIVMSRRIMAATLLPLMLLLALGGQQLLARTPSALDTALIRLKSVTFDPQAGEPAIPQSLRAPMTSGQGIYLLQFNGPVQEAWKSAVQQAGAQLYGYIPDHAFIARIDAAAIGQIRALPFVRWVGPYHPAYRLAPSLAQATVAGDVRVMAQTLPDADLSALAAQIDAWGGRVEGQASSPIAGYLRATLPASRLGSLASRSEVLWVDSYIPPQLANDIGGGQIMRANDVRQSLGLFGAGQIVAVADSGLDVGDPTTLHPDIRGRLVKAYCLGRTSPCDWGDPNGHGTHVAGSVLGNGSASDSTPAAHQYDGSFAGVAPEARLVMESIEASNGSLNGIPNDEGDLMRQAYKDGARIHTNSWGGPSGGTSQNPEYGGYIATSQQVDQAAWEHKDMLILFAAGNSGTDADADGVIDPDTIGQPGTAKNVITVGASENLRVSGGYNPGGACESWGDCWPKKYGAAPLAGDRPSDDANGMAAFSSRGPADDGRIKPELAAPGTNILSVRSHHADARPGWGEYNANYIYEGGTSMATPLTAGAAALVREWLVRVKGVANPSSALMKSVLINGAADMGPGQYGSGATQEIPSQRPNNVSGWGRVDLKAALDPPAPRQIWFADNTSGLSTGQAATYRVTVGAGNASQQTIADANAVSPQATTQLVQNGGFESVSISPWDIFGTPQFDSSVWHSGTRSIMLGARDLADDRILQTLSIPANASNASFDFWYGLATDETLAGFDQFCYGLYSNTSLTTPYIETCTDFAVTGDRNWTNEVYQLTPSELASVKGKSVVLAFYVQTDSSDPSRAWVDDITLTVTTTGSIDPTATPTRTATPTKTPIPPTNGRPLRLTLAWTDYPGQPAAAKALVNDLDLEIIAPNGTHYVGNQGLYSSGQCLRGGKWDACNNVEGIILPAAPAGTYTIIVRGAQVPQGGRQPFALTASGDGIQQGGRSTIFLPMLMRGVQTFFSARLAVPATSSTPVAAPSRAIGVPKPERRTQPIWP
jgi:subtilisin family serine protease